MIELMQRLNGQMDFVNERITELVEAGQKRLHQLRKIPRRAAGVVSSYDPEQHIPPAVVAMANGASFSELCLELGQPTSTLNNWRKDHPEFQEALEFGEELSQAWWMRKARLNIHNPLFNNQLFTLNMQNRYGWSKKVEGRIEGHVQENKTLTMNLNLRKVSDDDLEQVLEILTESEEISPDTDAGSAVRALLSEAV